MKKNAFIMLFLMSGIILVAITCKSKYNLSKNDYKYLPYKGTEKLIFLSNYLHGDTFCLTGYSKEIIENNFKEEKYLSERYILNYNASKRLNKYVDPLLNSYLFIEAHNDKKLLVLHTLWNKQFFFNSIRLDSLNLKATKSMNILNQNLTDIIEVSNNAIENTQKDSSAITKIYWSKSVGLVGYEKISGEKWRIVSKK